jgi:hypothetical protein
MKDVAGKIYWQTCIQGFTVFLFFLFQFFQHLAFALAQQLWAGFVLTFFYKCRLVAVIVRNNKAHAKGLRCKCSKQNQGCCCFNYKLHDKGIILVKSKLKDGYGKGDQGME